MKSLYESILDDEDILMGDIKNASGNWFETLKNMMSDPSSKEKDIISMLEKDKGFEKDILSVFRNKDDMEITPILWGGDEKHIGIFHKKQNLMMPDIEFAYCKDKSIYGNTNFVMKFNNHNMLNLYTEKNIKSKQTWSAIPNKLIKKYKLNLKQSPFMIGQLFIY
jgi:hypothetical protein